MRAIVIQCAPGADKLANIATVGRLIEAAVGGLDEAASGDPDEAASGATRPALVSLPEMWSCLGAGRAEKLAQSEALPAPGAPPHEAGPAYRFMAETAARLGITLHGGSIGERDGETLYNTTLVFGPDGAERARYRKIHLFDAMTPGGRGYRESSLFGAGDCVVTCTAGLPDAAPGSSPGAGPRLGLAICYDLRFPELFMALRRAGADIILVPAAFTVETGPDHWEVLLRARAIETQCWVVAAGTIGTHHDGAGRPRETYGHSLICDPWGRVVARVAAGQGEGFAEAVIDTAQCETVRAAMDVAAHRREWLLRSLAGEAGQG